MANPFDSPELTHRINFPPFDDTLMRWGPGPGASSSHTEHAADAEGIVGPRPQQMEVDAPIMVAEPSGASEERCQAWFDQQTARRALMVRIRRIVWRA